MSANSIHRREFLQQGATVVTVVSVCLCGLNGCATYTGISETPAAQPDAIAYDGAVLSIDLATEPMLQQIGGAVKVRNADMPDGLIIARVAENQYAVASLLCTHRGVELEYDHDKARFRCPSLGSSVFNLEGVRESGMARRPLNSYETAVEAGRLKIRV